MEVLGMFQEQFTYQKLAVTNNISLAEMSYLDRRNFQD